MIITPDQRQRLESGQPVRVEDPETHASYVVLKEEVYARIVATVEEGLDMRQVGDLVESAMAEEDAGDPLLDSYEKYR